MQGDNQWIVRHWQPVPTIHDPDGKAPLMPPYEPSPFEAVRRDLSRGETDRLIAWAHEHAATMTEDAPEWESERVQRLRREKTATVAIRDRLKGEYEEAEARVKTIDGQIRDELARGKENDG